MSSSTDYLVDYATRNIWCSPGMDRQHIVAPTRVTRHWGAYANVRIGRRDYNLPTINTYYHVFVVGDLPPFLVGMDEIRNKWVSARAHSVSTSLLIDTYTAPGKRIPSQHVYFLYTRDGNMVVAIKDMPIVTEIGTEQPYIRWRSNAWFDSKDAVAIDQGIEIEGYTYVDNNSFYAYQQLWRAAKAATPGVAMAYVNGKRIKDINNVTCKLGDIIEYVRDKSIREVVEYKLKDLKSFASTLDLKDKYLIARNGLGTLIDYVDDIDIFLLRYTTEFVYDGLYYHQNQVDGVRMVTHRDYAISTAYVASMIEAEEFWQNYHDIRVEVVVRHGGYRRPLVYNAQRIKELFKLPYTKRINAMIGPTANVSVWKAAALEASAYCNVIGALDGAITRPLARDALGYHAISRMVGDLPQKMAVSANARWLQLPWQSVKKGTVFEYNASGLLLGWYPHDYSMEYLVNNANAVYFEALTGEASAADYTIYDVQDFPVQSDTDYRFYVCTIWNNIPRNDWIDVTGDDDYYEIIDGLVKWKINPTMKKAAIRCDTRTYIKNFELSYRDRALAFSVISKEDVIVADDETDLEAMVEIPFGQIDVFLNGRTLIENLDYYVSWPEICIVNKEYLLDDRIQYVTVRGRGFCDKDFKRETARDWGFIAHRALSENFRFNLHDDQVARVVIGGQLYSRSELTWAENNGVLPAGIQNGAPYQVTNPIIPMKGLTDIDTYEWRDKSWAVDNEIEDYMSLYLPQKPPATPNPIPAWYRVYSPLCTKMIYDMLDGVINMNEFKEEYSLEWLRERMRGYDWLLKYDPSLKEEVDLQHVIIHPHPEDGAIGLNIYQYRLLDRVIQVMLDGRVSITRDLVVVEEGFEHDSIDHPHPHQTWESVGQ